MDKKTKKRFWKRVACVFGILFIFCLGFNAVSAVVYHYSIESLDVVYRIDDLSNEEMMELKTFLIQDKTNTLELTNNQINCVDYTKELIKNGESANINLGMAILREEYRFDNNIMLHAVVYTYVGDELVFIEPQTDNIYTTDELKDSYHFDYLAIINDGVEQIIYPENSTDFILNGDVK